MRFYDISRKCFFLLCFSGVYLQTFGIVFGLSDAILGLTFLAWGNSIGGEYRVMFVYIGIILSPS